MIYDFEHAAIRPSSHLICQPRTVDRGLRTRHLVQRIVLVLGLFVTASAFADSTNNWPALTLADAQTQALGHHPQIAAANYRALAAQEAVTETRAAFFPQANIFADAVGANQEGTRILAGGLNNPSVYDRGAGGIQVSQLLTDFGRTANFTASSKSQARAEDQNANATREQVLLQVDTSYFGALAAQAVLRVAQQTFDTRQLLLDQVTALATNKLRSALDVSFAQVQLQQAHLLLENSQNDAAAAMASLSAALGYGELHQFQLIEASPPDHAGTNDVTDLIQLALSGRPELLSLRNERDAASRYARGERDSRLPTIEAIGAAGDAPAHDSHLPDDYAVGGVQLELPIFAGGRYVAQQREAQLKAEADDELLTAAENNVIRDVRIAWLDFNNAKEQLGTTEQLAANADEAYTLAQARYKTGISSIVELSEAQLNLTSAQIAEANAQYGVYVQQANLNYQIGAMR
ncbi:MAG TPA: TolC family protein [Verrucomicrobiae bacterium]|jgi:outer membrane protein